MATMASSWTERVGGLVILAKHELKYRSILELSIITKDLECLCLLTNCHVHCVMNCLPHGHMVPFIDCVDKLLKFITEAIIGGDIKIDLLKLSADQATYFSTVE